MMHNNNRNKNRRFSKNNNFKKRRFGGGGGGSHHVEDEQQISPQQRRNFENKMQQHLMKAKEYLSAGERVEAENHFQHADHYYRMSVIGLDKIQQQAQQQPEDGQQDDNFEDNNSFAPQSNDAPAEEMPEIPVDMMGNFPSESGRQQRNQGNSQGRYNNQNRGQQRHHQPRQQQQQQNNGGEQEHNIGALPFMQRPLKEAE